jgi:cell wall-associated NlpC family hydrolase
VPAAVSTALIASPLVLASPAAADPSLSQLKSQITALSSKLDTLNDQFNTANVNLTKVKAQQATLTRQITVTQGQLSTLTSKTASYAISAYKGGDVSMMSSMIGSGSADAFLDQLTTLDALTYKTHDQLTALRTTKASLAAQQAKVAGLTQSAQTLVNTLTTSKAGYTSQLGTLKKLQQKLDPNGSSGSGGGADGPSADAPKAPVGSSTTVQYAYNQLGAHYAFAKSGPYKTGFDCSGLTLAAYRQVNISLPHSAHEQYQGNPHITRSMVQAGDLVFFNNFGHVGLAISNSQVIHAPQEGENVKISSIDSMGFVGAARPK